MFLLEAFKSKEPKVRCLTADMPDGSFMRPELSYDGKKVLFAYCKYYAKLADEPNKASKSECARGRVLSPLRDEASTAARGGS